MSSELVKNPILLAKLRNGDESAFRAIYDLHYRKIYQFANSFLKDKTKSEEILQETFLQIWIKRASLNVDLPIEPLLFIVCKRLVLDSFRKVTSTEKLRLNLLQIMREEDHSTVDQIIYADLLRITENAISELPKQQQVVVRLNKFDGLSYEEIAGKLNISKNTVKNHLVVALKTLRSQLDKEGVFYTILIILFSNF